VEGKRSGFRGSLLLLNSYFLNPALTAWSDDQILERGRSLLSGALRVWARPA
jgi:hypothetical protein